MTVILHNIRSLHNVGSIFRTADAVGVKKLFLCGITPSPLDRFKEVRPDIAKVALGAEKTVPWEKVESTEEVISRLKSEGYTIVALEQDKRAVPYYEYGNIQGAKSLLASPYSLYERENKSLPATAVLPLGKGEWDKTALILGAEVDGVSAPILEKSDRIIEIPMSGSKESLNVAVAFGIVAFALRDSAKANSKS